MKEPTYEEAIKLLKTHPDHWAALIKGIRLLRESKFSALKRNMETPNCNKASDDKIIGYMLACDDIAFEFEGVAKSQENDKEKE